MKNIVTRSSIIVLLLIAASPIYAGEGKANIALVSNYIFRGASVSNNRVVLQGGYEYDYGNSIVAGTWFSTLPSDTEYDIYARYSDDVGNFGYSAGFIYYGYTGSTVTPAEFNLALSYYGLSVVASSGKGVNYNEAAFETIVSDVTIRLHYGFDGSDENHGLRLGKQMGGMDVGLIYVSRMDSVSTLTTDVYALTIGKSF
ncbi:MAG: TorF family putative porin [Gammaproteobacteria bacterium]|nr:TorF family putative porin [Gammaproteobacteria bacterium]